ncbi:MAG: hypothetical protein WC011_02495 [Candidatus Paceibacterota bacterium]
MKYESGSRYWVYSYAIYTPKKNIFCRLFPYLNVIFGFCHSVGTAKIGSDGPDFKEFEKRIFPAPSFPKELAKKMAIKWHCGGSDDFYGDYVSITDVAEVSSSFYNLSPGEKIISRTKPKEYYSFY